jgi:two-component system sensor histidine kinase ChvG
LEGIYASTKKPGDPDISFTIEEEENGTGRYNVIGIEGRLGQVLRNLIANASSFSKPDDTIKLNMKRRSYQGKDYIWITVDDQGPGIPKENLETIFQRFYTERPDPDAFGKNSGLGLSISRQIIEAHEGKIWAENRQDPTSGDTLGARFVVLLPTKKQRESMYS